MLRWNIAIIMIFIVMEHEIYGNGIHSNPLLAKSHTHDEYSAEWHLEFNLEWHSHIRYWTEIHDTTIIMPPIETHLILGTLSCLIDMYLITWHIISMQNHIIKLKQLCCINFSWNSCYLIDDTHYRSDDSVPQKKKRNVQVYRAHDITFSTGISWTARCD